MTLPHCFGGAAQGLGDVVHLEVGELGNDLGGTVRLVKQGAFCCWRAPHVRGFEQPAGSLSGSE